MYIDKMPGPSLVPSPTPSFSSLAVRYLPYCKRQKAGRGTGNEASLDPVLARDAIAQGCWCVRVRSYTELIQTHEGGETSKAYLCLTREPWAQGRERGYGVLGGGGGGGSLPHAAL